MANPGPASTSGADGLYGGDAAGGSTLGLAATSLIGFYGATPVAQRTATVQAASLVSASSYITVGSNLAAFAAEVSNTLTGLGLWKGG